MCCRDVFLCLLQRMTLSFYSIFFFFHYSTQTCAANINESHHIDFFIMGKKKDLINDATSWRGRKNQHWGVVRVRNVELRWIRLSSLWGTCSLCHELINETEDSKFWWYNIVLYIQWMECWWGEETSTRKNNTLNPQCLITGVKKLLWFSIKSLFVLAEHCRC